MIPITTRQFIYEIGQLRLRGDVIIRCYQITPTNERTLNLHAAKTLNRELIFSTQFHTCAITERDITFYRNELDYACDGKFSIEKIKLFPFPKAQKKREKNVNWTFKILLRFPCPSYFFISLALSLSLRFFFSDPRIPVDHKVTLHFGDNNQLNENRSLHFQSPLVKLEPLNAVAKYNSLERFDDGKYLCALFPTIVYLVFKSSLR